MSNKHKHSRKLSKVAFWSLLLFIIGIVLVIDFRVADYRYKQADIRPSNYDSFALTTKQQLAALNVRVDSLQSIKKNIINVGDGYFPKEIHDSLFSFEIVYDSTKNVTRGWQFFIRSLTIFFIADHKKIQTVIPPKPSESNLEIFPVFVVEDMNFDGYPDFRVLDFVPMYACETYYYWLYNPKKKQFEKNAALEVTSSVIFDEQSKTITSYFRGGGPFDERNEIFSWDKDKLALQYSEEVFMGLKDMEGVLTMKKRIDGKLMKRSKKIDTIPFSSTGNINFDWDMLK
ncbi:hypothetical protein BH11BAC7_BH11BAC7_19560 [soil metagenome]